MTQRWQASSKAAHGSGGVSWRQHLCGICNGGGWQATASSLRYGICGISVHGGSMQRRGVASGVAWRQQRSLCLCNIGGVSRSAKIVMKA